MREKVAKTSKFTKIIKINEKSAKSLQILTLKFNYGKKGDEPEVFS